MSGSRCIPGLRGPVSALSCPASGRDCPKGITGPGRKRCYAGPRRRGGAVLPGRVRTGRCVRCQVIALEQARQYLETLGLKQSVEILDNTLDTAANKQLTYPEMLEQLLGAEVAARRERYLTTRTKMAHFPFQRTLEQFDFAFQPSIDERQVKELTGLAFVAEVFQQHTALGTSRRGQNPSGHSLGQEGHRPGLRRLLRPGLRPDGGPQESPGGTQRWTGGCESTWRPRCWWWTSSASGPMTGMQQPPSSPWSRPGTSGAASS